jgi:hypothetical protein
MRMQNADCGYVPRYEHDEPLYREKREQMAYNVEPRSTVDRRYRLPSRCRLLGPLLHHHDYRHLGSCMYYTDGPDPRRPVNPRPFDMQAIMSTTSHCPRYRSRKEIGLKLLSADDRLQW